MEKLRLREQPSHLAKVTSLSKWHSFIQHVFAKYLLYVEFCAEGNHGEPDRPVIILAGKIDNEPEKYIKQDYYRLS